MAIGTSLAGCANKHGVLTLHGGACEAFDAPEDVVRGKTRDDQTWIDGQVEGGVGACEWARPKPRPVVKATPRKRLHEPVAVTPAGDGEADRPIELSAPDESSPNQIVKKHWWQRFP